MFSLRIYFKGVDSATLLRFDLKQDRDEFFRSITGAMRSADSEPFLWNDGAVVISEVRMVEKL